MPEAHLCVDLLSDDAMQRRAFRRKLHHASGVTFAAAVATSSRSRCLLPMVGDAAAPCPHHLQPLVLPHETHQLLAGSSQRRSSCGTICASSNTASSNTASSNTASSNTASSGPGPCLSRPRRRLLQLREGVREALQLLLLLAYEHQLAARGALPGPLAAALHALPPAEVEHKSA
jgi:hypothetical protein